MLMVLVAGSNSISAIPVHGYPRAGRSRLCKRGLLHFQVAASSEMATSDSGRGTAVFEEGRLDHPKWSGETPLSRLVSTLISIKPIFSILKLGARQVLISTAEKKNIPWREMTREVLESDVYSELETIRNASIVYPDYYLSPFHAYDEGNLSWLAAAEAEAATMSMVRRALPDVASQDEANQIMYGGWLGTIEKHHLQYSSNNIQDILDIGCSVGVSTRHLADKYPSAKVTVAREFHLPSVFLWNQPAAVLGIYYHYFHGYEEIINDNIKDSSWSIELPGLPLFSGSDLPPFLTPSDVPNFAVPGFRRHFEELEKEETPTVLVNSFEELENRAFKSIENLNLIPVGPLIPSAFLTGDDPSDTSFGGDLFKDKKDLYMEWLSSMPSRSVIYVAFGTIRSVSKQQLEEIAAGLLKSNRPFLWVIRTTKNKGDAEEDESEELSCRKELEKLGKIVPWCSQVEVLSCSSVGVFFSHCGWNSTLESLVAGVPVVAFPHWSDQFTNAKLVEDEWRCGVRVKTNGDGVAEGEEIRRCLEMVMGDGERAAEMKANARKWKELGKKAAIGGGSSDKKMKAFVDAINRGGWNGHGSVRCI